MKQVNFLEVGMENFGPYIDPMILNFKNDSLTLMVGPNGIGKTMSLEAVPFTLYGVTIKGAKGDDVVNEGMGKNCHTWVKFTVDSDEYKVDRYHKYTKLGNTVILNKNGVDIKKGSREVVPEIERILCPKKSFENTLMFGQKVKDFFTDLVDSDKKEIFRKILSLDNYTLYYRKADELLKETIEQTNSLATDIKVNVALIENLVIEIDITEKEKVRFGTDKETKISGYKQSISENERMIERWNKDIENLKEQNHNVEEVIEEINKCKTQLELVKQSYDSRYSKIVSQKTEKIAELEKAASNLTKGILADREVKIKQANDIIRKDEDEVRNELQELEVKVSDLKNQRTEYSTNIRLLNNERETFHEAIEAGESICPTCLQDIDEDHKEHLQNEIDSIDTKINEFGVKVTEINEELDTIEEIFKKPRMKLLDELKEKINQDLKKIDSETDEELNESDQKLENLKTKVDELFSQEVSKLDQDIKDEKESLQDELLRLGGEKASREVVLDSIQNAEKSIKSLESGIESLELLIADTEKQEYDESKLNGYKGKLIELKKNNKEMNNQLKELNYKTQIYEFWKSAFSSSGIPSMLIDEAIPFMNRTVADYLERMTNGRYIVSFDTLATTKAGEFRDKISVNVLDTHTKASSRVKLSGGQTRIIDIATILTLGDLQSNIQDVSFNILFFDEIFDSLDEENIGFVSKILRKLKISRSIFLISHRHEDQLEADEVLTLN